jgi:TrwC relaxase
MTVRVTTLKGAEAGVYYVEQLPNYYLQSGEPRGVWCGAGAGLLDLTGDVVDDAFLAVMAGMDPAHPKPVPGAPLRRHLGSGVRCHVFGPEVGVGALRAR